MATKLRPDVTRGALIDAAKRVLRDKGIGLSLDAVAKDAGISKGGLLHHFPGRQQLLIAVRDSLMEDFHERLDAIRSKEAKESGKFRSGSWLRAYIELSLRMDDGNQALFAALAPLLSHEEVHGLASDTRYDIIGLTESDGIPIARAHAIRLACDAFWFSRTSSLPTLSEDARLCLKQQLLAWTMADD